MTTDRGGENIPTPDELTEAERACLLRAARRRVEELQQELEPLKSLLDLHSAGRRYEILSEINCFNKAISWLWRQHTK